MTRRSFERGETGRESDVQERYRGKIKEFIMRLRKKVGEVCPASRTIEFLRLLLGVWSRSRRGQHTP